MKKALVLLSLILPAVLFAVPQKKKIKKKKAPQSVVVTSIEFESFTRRQQIQLLIKQDSAIYTGRHDKKYILLTAQAWKDVTATLHEVKLEAIPGYESPTHRRETDGASHCRIKVVTTKSQYETQYFDGGQPMKQLKALYDRIEEIKNRIEATGKTLP